jgi:hypothetical protein
MIIQFIIITEKLSSIVNQFQCKIKKIKKKKNIKLKIENYFENN